MNLTGAQMEGGRIMTSAYFILSVEGKIRRGKCLNDPLGRTRKRERRRSRDGPLTRRLVTLGQGINLMSHVGYRDALILMLERV